VAQLVKYWTLDFISGGDLRVMRLSPALRSMLGEEPDYDSLPLLLPLSPSPGPSQINK